MVLGVELVARTMVHNAVLLAQGEVPRGAEVMQALDMHDRSAVEQIDVVLEHDAAQKLAPLKPH